LLFFIYFSECICDSGNEVVIAGEDIDGILISGIWYILVFVPVIQIGLKPASCGTSEVSSREPDLIFIICELCREEPKVGLQLDKEALQFLSIS
jgi:hypothetical protein